jgi:endoglucanase
MMKSIWENEVVYVAGKPYIVSNNIEKASPATMILNPSYLAPYTYRIFAKIDTAHPWMDVVDTSYDVINKSMELPLGNPISASIPPDWVSIDRRTGAIIAPTHSDLSTDMSFDALRVPWRLALDWYWFNEPRAKTTLSKMEFLSNEWKSNSLLYTAYTHSGEPIMRSQSAAFYGGTIGYFMVVDPENAKAVYDNKLQTLYNPDTDSWKVQLGYYDDNWAWFGIALYNNLLPNLFTEDLENI